jgi:hypothetical protein
MMQGQSGEQVLLQLTLFYPKAFARCRLQPCIPNAQMLLIGFRLLRSCTLQLTVMSCATNIQLQQVITASLVAC